MDEHEQGLLHPDQFGHIKGCHDPRNESCPQNADVKFDCACKSARIVNRKPFKQVRVTDSQVGRGIRPEIVAELWPDGRLVLREAGRRLRVETTLGVIYEQCVARDARRAAMAKRNKRRTR